MSPVPSDSPMPAAADWAPPVPAQAVPGYRPPATAPGRTDLAPAAERDLTPDGLPRIHRQVQGRLIGGVSVGIAAHLNVKVLWVRAIFSVLAACAGAGILAYALLWMFVPLERNAVPGAPASATDRRQAIGIAAIGIALAVAGTAIGLGDWIGWVLGPLGLAVVGGAFIWREADEGRRARWRRTAAGFVTPSRGSWWRLIGGAALVVSGLLIFAVGRLDITAVRSAVAAVVLTLVGVAILTVPWWIRLVRDLGEERAGRIREQERAEIAAHLHDSVLQTLALIQRQAADPRQVQRLARSQERQLRTWLYGPAGYTSAAGLPGTTDQTLAQALGAAVAEVEDTYPITADLVMVGDAPMDPQLAALAAAAREAMVNAAKHSGAPSVSVYAEIADDTVEVFVRDRGAGFEESAVAADRRGLAESVHGRMRRHGGGSHIRTAPGEGTEVVLTMPLRTSAVSLVKTEPGAAGSAAGPAAASVQTDEKE